MKITGSNVLERNLSATSRVVVNEGGTRSSKTISLCKMFIVKMLSETGKFLTICRKSGPILNATVKKDFLDCLKELGIYQEENHDIGPGVYHLNGNEIAFISLDQPTKLKGRSNNYVWINEANECSYEDFFQLNIRLSKPSREGKPNQIFLDYNPSDEYSWLYEKIIPRPDCTFIHSTYLDNPFLDADTIQTIEALKDADDNYFKIYGLGERATSTATIYSHWQVISMEDYLSKKVQQTIKDSAYGLDFGFNHPTALIDVSYSDTALYWDELLYKSYLTTPELIEKLQSLITKRNKFIFADGSRPEIIEDIRKKGLLIKPAIKEVTEGIKSVKTKPLFITERSINTLKEIKAYKWKTSKDERVLDEPVGLNDDAMDAGRYGTYSQFKGKMIAPHFTIISRK